MGVIAEFKKGRDAAYKRRGFVPGRKAEPAAGTADEKDGGGAAGNAADADGLAELAETRGKLLEELSAEVEKRVAELETERDEYKKLLADVVTAAEGERDENKKLLADVAAEVEARIAEVESERDLFADVLQAPRVHTVLKKALHTDTYPKADADERRRLTEAFIKMKAAYDLIGAKGKKP
jgi:hypothetical protein